jgi:aminoglycoside phosphotransferase (APT) family kinase protein
VRHVDALCRDLLGAAPDEVEALVVLPDRATWLVTIDTGRFVVKTDDDRRTTSNEIAGHRRAAAAGVRVPEILGATDDAFAMRWVDGTTLRDHATPAAWRAAGAQVRLVHDVGGEPPFGTGFGGFNPTRPTWRSFFELFAETMLANCERNLGFPREQGDRIRDALRGAPQLDTPHLVWCHGDLQPEHVLVDPATDRVAAIIDWADHGSGDFGWDVAVLTIEHEPDRDAFLDGYGATREQRDALAALLPLYSVVRLVGEAGWFAEHGFPFADNLRRAQAWPLR